MANVEQVNPERPHLWLCGCLVNEAGAHRKGCPDFPEGQMSGVMVLLDEGHSAGADEAFAERLRDFARSMRKTGLAIEEGQ